MSKYEFLEQDIGIVESLPSVYPSMQPFEEEAVINVVKALREYEERGILLPCEVGDTVYDIFMGEVKEKKVVSVVYFHSPSVKQITVHASNERGATTPIELYRFGKTVFLTEQEAQSALEKMKGE